VDEWLTVNATCPTCRKSVFPAEGESLSGNSTTTPNNNNNNNTRGTQDPTTTGTSSSTTTGSEQRQSNPNSVSEGVPGNDEGIQQQTLSTTAVRPTSHRSFLSIFGSTSVSAQEQQEHDTTTSLSARSSGDCNETTPLRTSDHQSSSSASAATNPIHDR